MKSVVPGRCLPALICLASLGQDGCRTSVVSKMPERRAPPSDLVVTVRREPYASVISYDLTKVMSDGEVSFNGQARPAIGLESVARIWEGIEASDFFHLEDEYGMRAVDTPTTVITIQANGVQKRVLVMSAAPEYFELDRLALGIEELALTRALLKWR